MQNSAVSNRKIKQGVVISNKMHKTLIVRVDRKFRHPQYDKIVTARKKYYAHTEQDDFKVGDVVEICETRPISKLKRWRVTKLIKRPMTVQEIMV